MTSFKVLIEFTDGTSETMTNVHQEILGDGVLCLNRDRTYSGGRIHLGSWPIVNIKKWTRMES